MCTVLYAVEKAKPIHSYDYRSIVAAVDFASQLLNFLRNGHEWYMPQNHYSRGILASLHCASPPQACFTSA